VCAIGHCHAQNSRRPSEAREDKPVTRRTRSPGFGNHHFIVLYRHAKRDPGRTPSFWLGHVTHILIDKAGRESAKRIAFTNLDDLPTIIRRCIGLDPTSCEPRLSEMKRRQKGRRRLAYTDRTPASPGNDTNE
jgi:hypothetical protein